jgi:hypothetical protein
MSTGNVIFTVHKTETKLLPPIIHVHKLFVISVLKSQDMTPWNDFRRPLDFLFIYSM